METNSCLKREDRRRRMTVPPFSSVSSSPSLLMRNINSLYSILSTLIFDCSIWLQASRQSESITSLQDGVEKTSTFKSESRRSNEEQGEGEEEGGGGAGEGVGRGKEGRRWWRRKDRSAEGGREGQERTRGRSEELQPDNSGLNLESAFFEVRI